MVQFHEHGLRAAEIVRPVFQRRMIWYKIRQHFADIREVFYHRTGSFIQAITNLADKQKGFFDDYAMGANTARVVRMTLTYADGTRKSVEVHQ